MHLWLDFGLLGLCWGLTLLSLWFVWVLLKVGLGSVWVWFRISLYKDGVLYNMAWFSGGLGVEYHLDGDANLLDR